MAAAIVGACATVLTQDSPEDVKRDAVAKSALARWDLVIGRKAGEAYDLYMSKGSRQVLSRTDFDNMMRKTDFRTAAVEKVECGATSCQASMRVTYDHKLIKGVVNPMRENWIIEDGQARYVWSP